MLCKVNKDYTQNMEKITRLEEKYPNRMEVPFLKWKFYKKNRQYAEMFNLSKSLVGQSMLHFILQNQWMKAKQLYARSLFHVNQTK